MDRPTRVIHILTRMNVGGVSRSVAASIDESIRSGATCLLVAGRLAEGEEDMSYLVEGARVTQVYVNSLDREVSLNDFVSLWKLWWIFIQFRPDVVCTHMAKAGALGRLAAFLYKSAAIIGLRPLGGRCRTVHTFHGNVFDGYFNSFSSRLIVWIERLYARFLTDEIVALSAHQRTELLHKYGIGSEGKCKVSPHRFKAKDFEFSAAGRRGTRARHGIEDDNLLIGFVGRLVGIKNPHLFVEAANVLSSTNTSKNRFQFAVIGDGPLRPALERATECENKARISFLGHQRHMRDLYSALDVLCLTSLNEGVPFVLLEAMAASCPVIATDVGGVAELLGTVVYRMKDFEVRDRGLMLSRPDQIALCNAILHLSSDVALRRRISRKAHFFVLDYRESVINPERSEPGSENRTFVSRPADSGFSD